MIREFKSWDEAKRAYGWTSADPIARAAKAAFEIGKRKKMTDRFQVIQTAAGFRVFDQEAERFAQGEYQNQSTAATVADELETVGSYARVKHDEAILDLLSGIDAP